MYKSDRNLDVNSHLYRYWISALIDAASGIVNNVWGSVEADEEREFNAEQAKINRQFQRNERLAAQEFELDMWNRNNEYNDIGSQIARARAAGVNPAAILNGEYKSATSAPVTTDAAPGSQASSNTGFGAALAGSGTNISRDLLSTAETKEVNETLELNKTLISTNIAKNEQNLLLMAKDMGIKDATKEQIEKASSWMDALNFYQVREKVAAINNLQIENYEIIQQILESRTRASYNEALTEGVQIENKYKPKIFQNQLSVEQLEIEDLRLRKQVAKLLGVPLGSSEFEFNYISALTGKFPDYVNNVLVPQVAAQLKPNELIVPIKKGFKNKVDLGLLGDYVIDNGSESYIDFQKYRRALLNPTVPHNEAVEAYKKYLQEY